MPDSLFALPWAIQLSLASGYAAYLLCYVGIRSKHTPVDVIFSTLVFGLVASGISYTSNINEKPVAASLLAFILTCVSGLLWRWAGRKSLRWLLRHLNVSWVDDDPSALTSILYDSSRKLSQLGVLLEDGTWLECQNLSNFENSPFGPCKLGAEGDVALYVTHTCTPDGEEKEHTSTKDGDFGDRITWVPASKIKRITFRHV